MSVRHAVAACAVAASLAVPARAGSPYVVQVGGAEAFSIPVEGLSRKQLRRFAKGREFFNEPWVVAPDPSGVWGLGPTFNEDRCSGCHARNGRSAAHTDDGDVEGGAVVRLGLAGRGPTGAPVPDPVYGGQLQNRGIEGRVPAEGRAVVRYELEIRRLRDGTRVELRRPRIELRDLAFGPLSSQSTAGMRIAPQMVGLGLLEWVPEASVEAIAAAQPAAGVSGRPNRVWDVETERVLLGRFGWKAGQPSIRQQTATAFHLDIGATTYLFPEENCPEAQRECRDLPSAAKCGGQGGCTGHSYRPEVVPSRLSSITLYLHTLAVPARRDRDDPQVARGERLFERIGCAACHLPVLTTSPDAPVAVGREVTFHAYTDLLVHDMGGGLADARGEFEADGSEWRTAPLWGLGLLAEVNGNAHLLHDGRARSVTEAILWHGGEAGASRDAFAALSGDERAALVRFVRSL